MAEWFAHGRLIDAIVLLMVFESAALLFLRKKLRHGLSTAALASTLAAGAALLMALRAALTGEAWIGIAGWLCIALVAHVIDLTLRWNRSIGS